MFAHPFSKLLALLLTLLVLPTSLVACGHDLAPLVACDDRGDERDALAPVSRECHRVDEIALQRCATRRIALRAALLPRLQVEDAAAPSYALPFHPSLRLGTVAPSLAFATVNRPMLC